MPHNVQLLLVQLVENITAAKTSATFTKNQQIYSSKGGLNNVMERLRICGMLFLVNLNDLKGKEAMNRPFCMVELTFLGSVKGVANFDLDEN